MTLRLDTVGQLPLEVTSVELRALELQTRAGWTRRSTVVCISGGGVTGMGEDVTYDADDQLSFQRSADSLRLQGRYSLDEFSHHLDHRAAYPQASGEPGQRLYRRWAFESAALELALRQAGRSLADVLQHEPQPVNYVVSLGLGDPPTAAPLRAVLEVYPQTRFKVDFAENWTRAIIEELAALDCIDVVDLKGLYRGAFQGPPANAELYSCVAELLPHSWLEDPELTDETRGALEPHAGRITWDANLHSVADIAGLPFEPRCINIKPSRFGFLAELLRCYAYCGSRGIAMYGGGQFELGPGRRHIQSLAALFHPGAPNDVAPGGFNERELPHDLPASPLVPPEFPAAV